MEKWSGLSKGIPAGLRWTLFFLLCFYLLGYSSTFSIGLSLLGGLAISLIVDWWKSKDELLEQPSPELKEIPSAQPPTRADRRQLRQSNRSKQRGIKRFTWPYRRGKS